MSLDRNALMERIISNLVGRVRHLESLENRLQIFTVAPALADLGVGSIAIGDGTGPTGQDELFFKPDAAKIVSLMSDGTARTII